MTDEVPSTKLAVYLFLEMIALGFALEAVAAFMRGAEWWRWLGAIGLGIVFMVLGVKSGAVIDRCSGRINWKLWGRWIRTTSQVLFGVTLVAVVFLAVYEWRMSATAQRDLQKPLGFVATNNPQGRATTPPAPALPRLRYNPQRSIGWTGAMLIIGGAFYIKICPRLTFENYSAILST